MARAKTRRKFSDTQKVDSVKRIQAGSNVSKEAARIKVSPTVVRRWINDSRYQDGIATKGGNAPEKPITRDALRDLKRDQYKRNEKGEYLCEHEGCDNTTHSTGQGIGAHFRSYPDHRTAIQKELFSKLGTKNAARDKKRRAAPMTDANGMPMVQGVPTHVRRSNFCTACGLATFEIHGHFCGKCGEVSKAGWQFCPGCGTSTAQKVIEEQPQEAPA